MRFAMRLSLEFKCSPFVSSSGFPDLTSFPSWIYFHEFLRSDQDLPVPSILPYLLHSDKKSGLKCFKSSRVPLDGGDRFPFDLKEVETSLIKFGKTPSLFCFVL